MGPRRLLDTPEVNVALFAFLLHLPWEFWQVPFFAGVASAPHWAAIKVCTSAAAGDALIAVLAFLVVAAGARSRRWILRPSWRSIAACVAVGLAVTAVIERISTAWGRWTYGEAMPIVPVLEVGLLPLLQWVVLPLLTVWFVRRQLWPSSGQSLEGRNAQIRRLSGRRHCATCETAGRVHHLADGSPSPKPFPE